jgi:hypothetical protein
MAGTLRRKNRFPRHANAGEILRQRPRPAMTKRFRRNSSASASICSAGVSAKAVFPFTDSPRRKLYCCDRAGAEKFS